MSAVPPGYSDRDAEFRREAAHALSTPLGSLLLQAELIDHLLAQKKTGKARQVATSLVAGCESFGHLLRTVFHAMADMAETRGDGDDPRSSLERVLVELGDDSIDIGYLGESPRVGVPSQALNALMRRLAAEAMALGARHAVLAATRENGALRLSLTADGAQQARLQRHAFDGNARLNLWTVDEIARRHHGCLMLGGRAPEVLAVLLPLAPDPLQSLAAP